MNKIRLYVSIIGMAVMFLVLDILVRLLFFDYPYVNVFENSKIILWIEVTLMTTGIALTFFDIVRDRWREIK